MKVFRRLLSIGLALSLLSMLFVSTTVLQSSALTETEVFAFSEEANVAQNGIKEITYTAEGGMTITSDDDNPQVIMNGGNQYLAQDQKSWITADFDLASADQEVLAAVLADKQLYQLAVDVNLESCMSIGAASINHEGEVYGYPAYLQESTEVMGMGTNVIITISGTRDIDGHAVPIETSGQAWVSPVEHPEKTVLITIPEEMTAVTGLNIKFDNTSWRIHSLVQLQCAFSAVKAVQLDTAMTTPAPAQNDCFVDFTSRTDYVLDGCSRSMISGGTDMAVTEDAFAPLSGVQFSGVADFGDNNVYWCWEDTCASAYIEPGLLEGYDGLTFYVKMGENNYTDQLWGLCLFGYLPDRNEDGTYNYDENGNIKYEYTSFECRQNARPSITKDGNAYKIEIPFDEYRPDITKLPSDFGYYFDDKTAADCLEYIDSIKVGCGMMAIGRDQVIDFAISDIYGYTTDESGETVSGLPEIGGEICEHTFGEWEITNEESQYNASRVCSACGYTEYADWIEEAPVPTYTQGDVTGDGYINNKDLARLKAYLADDTVEMVVEAADVAGSNGILDGYINNKDYARIKRYCADPEGVKFDQAAPSTPETGE